MTKITYKLGLVNSLVNYPKKTRQLLSALQDAKEQKSVLNIADALSHLGELFIETEDWAKSIHYAREELDNSKFIPLPRKLECQCQALYRLGRACREIEEFDAAIQYQNDYLSIAEKLNNQKEILQAKFDLGVSFLARGESQKCLIDDFKTACSYFKDAGKQLLRTDMDSQDKALLKAQIYMNLGITFKYTDDVNKAIEMINYSLRIYSQAGDKLQEASAYCNLALCYEQKKDLKTSIQNNMLEMRMYQSVSDTQGVVKSLWDLAIRLTKTKSYKDAKMAYLKFIDNCKILDEMDDVDRATEAIRNLDKIIKASEEISAQDLKIKDFEKVKDQRSEFLLRGQRGGNYMMTGEYSKAIADFEWQKFTAQKLKMSTEQLLKVYQRLGEAYFQESRFPEALDCFREYLKYEQNEIGRLELQCKIGTAMEATALPFSQINRHYINYLSDSKACKSVKHQRNALNRLIGLNQKFNYLDTVKQLDIQLRKLDSSTEKCENDTETDDVGSIDSDAFQNLEDSLPNIADIMTDSDTSEPQKKKRLIKPTLMIEKEATNKSEPSKKSLEKYKIQTLNSDKSPQKSFKNSSNVVLITSDDEESGLSEISQPKKCKKKARVSKYQIQTIEESDITEDDEYENQDNENLILSSFSPKEKRKMQLEIIKRRNFSRKRLQITSSSQPSINNSKYQDQESGDDENEISQNDASILPIFNMENSKDICSANNDNVGSVGNSSRSLTCTPEKMKKNPLPNSQPQAQPMKIKVCVKNPSNEDEIFAIPCVAGPSGTPKTIKWLMDETSRRYRILYKKTPQFHKLIVKDDETQENETLFGEDIIENVIENKQKVYAILK